MGQTFFPINYINVTPGVGVWVDIDLSPYIPDGATMAIFHIRNTSGSTNYSYGLRCNGSTDDRYGILSANVHTWVMVKVDASRIIEAKIENATYLELYLTGYTVAGVTGFVNGVDVTPTVYGWNDIDLASYLPAGALAAIFEIYSATSGTYYGIRKKGSTDGRTGSASYKNQFAFVVGVDSNRVCQGTSQFSDAKFYLLGYITQGVVMHTNATDKSLGVTGSYQDIYLADNAVFGFFEIMTNILNSYALRRKGDAQDYFHGVAYHPMAVVACDGSGFTEGKISSLYVDFFLLGYAAITSEITKLESELVVLSDQPARRMRIVKIKSDTVNIIASKVRRNRLVRFFSEVMGMPDLGKGVLCGFVDLEQVLDVATFVGGMVKTIAEVLSAIESSVRRSRTIRLLVETVSILDSFLRRALSVRILSEVVGVVETFVKHVLVGLIKLMTEVVDIVDAIFRRDRTTKLVAEDIEIVETASRSQGFVRVFVEAVSIIEVVSRRLWSIKLLAETISIAETVLRSFRSIKILNETVLVVEATLRRLRSIRPFEETILIVESALRRQGFVKLFMETMSILETKIRGISLVRIVTEAVSIIETKLRRQGFVRLFSEPVSIVEVTLRRLRSIRLLAESISVIEIVLRRHNFVKLIGEAVSIIETAIRVVGEGAIVKFIVEVVNVVEAMGKRGRSVREIIESIYILDFMIIPGFLRRIAFTVWMYSRSIIVKLYSRESNVKLYLRNFITKMKE